MTFLRAVEGASPYRAGFSPWRIVGDGAFDVPQAQVSALSSIVVTNFIFLVPVCYAAQPSFIPLFLLSDRNPLRWAFCPVYRPFAISFVRLFVKRRTRKTRGGRQRPPPHPHAELALRPRWGIDLKGSSNHDRCRWEGYSPTACRG